MLRTGGGRHEHNIDADPFACAARSQCQARRVAASDGTLKCVGAGGGMVVIGVADS